MDRKLGGMIAVGLLAAGGLWSYVDMRESDKALAEKSASPWSDLSSVDPMTDAPKVAFMNRATDAVLDSVGRPVRPNLFVDCIEGTTTLSVIASGLIIPSGGHSVMLRMDTEPTAEHAFFSSGRDSMIAEKPIPILRKLTAKRVGVLRVRMPTDLGDRDTAFDVSGVDEHLAKIEKACNWQ